MRGINRVTLIGNLGKDPDLRILDTGIAVAKLSLATTEIYKLKDGNSHVQTTWHQVVAWRGLASLAANYLRKGSLIYVEGRLQYRNYEDVDGQKHYITEIIADQFLILDKKPDTKAGIEDDQNLINERPPF